MSERNKIEIDYITGLDELSKESRAKINKMIEVIRGDEELICYVVEYAITLSACWKRRRTTPH